MTTTLRLLYLRSTALHYLIEILTGEIGEIYPISPFTNSKEY